MKRSPWRTINLVMLAVFALAAILYATGFYAPPPGPVTRDDQRQTADIFVGAGFVVFVATFFFLKTQAYRLFIRKDQQPESWHTLGSTVESVAEEEERLRSEA